MALARNYLLKNNTGLISDDEARVQIEPLIHQTREQDPENKLARAFELMLKVGINSGSSDATEQRMVTDELRDLLAVVPTETYIRLRVADILVGQLDDKASATEVLRAGLLIDPLAADLHAQLGQVYMADHRLEAARVELEKARQLAPDNPNHYYYLSSLEKENNNLPAALEWARRAVETDPQDHELAADLAQDLYVLELPEEGDRWYARVKALAPGSPVARRVELNRALARKDDTLAEALAKSMISDQVENRQSAFFVAAYIYTDLKLRSGTAKQGYDFLVSTRPEITDYSARPDTSQGRIMQNFSITMMAGFEPFEVRKQAWLQHAAALDAGGQPWRRFESSNITRDAINTGNIEAAIEHFLAYELKQSLAKRLWQTKRYLAPFYADVYADTRVAAVLAEKDKEFAQLRETVSQLMLEPEWNQ